MGLGRRSFLGIVALAAFGACFASTEQHGQEEGVRAEDDLRFRAGAVDKTLPDVDAVGYEIALRVEDTAGHETFTADVKGTFVATRALDELTLDLEGNVVDEVSVGGRTAPHRREGAALTITLPTPATEGSIVSTRVKLHGDVRQADGANPNDFTTFGGLMVRQHNADGRKIFTSLDWPSKARRWLPVKDHPRDGAAVAFDVTFPKTYVVLANGKKLGETENADGTKTWRYEANTPMPTYDFHVSAYDDWQVNAGRASSGVPISTYTYTSSAQHVDEIYGDLPKAFEFYESIFGPYRWGTANFLEEPIFGGGMEHASVVSMDETLFRNPRSARDTAFHELAHHWSGNLVRIRQWNDFWLSEGFTEYLKARALTQIYGEAEKKRVYSEYRSRAFAADARKPHPLAPRGDEIDVLTIFDAISYQKGALVLRMLERIVGEKTLTTFLAGWFERHAFQAVSTADFERELSEAAGRDLSAFFASFVYAASHPELRVTFAGTPGGETDVTVEQVQSVGPQDGYVFPLDLDFVDAAGATERVTIELTSKTTTKRIRLGRTPSSVVVDPEQYAIATIAE
ncbi:MAG TPA: M1 family metallopeptidase [Labilithrix sp.]|nr:M1 family metallopeptidase [Labilithrix sp.]